MSRSELSQTIPVPKVIITAPSPLVPLTLSRGAQMHRFNPFPWSSPRTPSSPSASWPSSPASPSSFSSWPSHGQSKYDPLLPAPPIRRARGTAASPRRPAFGLAVLLLVGALCLSGWVQGPRGIWAEHTDPEGLNEMDTDVHVHGLGGQAMLADVPVSELGFFGRMEMGWGMGSVASFFGYGTVDHDHAYEHDKFQNSNIVEQGSIDDLTATAPIDLVEPTLDSPEHLNESDASTSDSATADADADTPSPETFARPAKAALSPSAWQAYLASMTSLAGPQETMEAWAFH